MIRRKEYTIYHILFGKSWEVGRVHPL